MLLAYLVGQAPSRGSYSKEAGGPKPGKTRDSWSRARADKPGAKEWVASRIWKERRMNLSYSFKRKPPPWMPSDWSWSVCPKKVKQCILLWLLCLQLLKTEKAGW